MNENHLTDKSYIDLVLLRARLLAQRRIFWLREHGYARQDGLVTFEQEIHNLLNDVDNPFNEIQWQSQHELSTQIEQVTHDLSQDSSSRLAQLSRIFALDELDIDILHLTLAQAIDPSLGRLFAYLHDDSRRAYVTPHLVARLCMRGRFLQWDSQSSLQRWRMVVPDATGLDAQFHALWLDNTIRDWLVGKDTLDSVLTDYVQLIKPMTPLGEWTVEETAQAINQSLARDPMTTVIVELIGQANSGKKTFAACVAVALGMPLLFIDEQYANDPRSIFIHAQRHAFLNRTALAWRKPPQQWLGQIAHFPVQFILSETERYSGSIPDSVSLVIKMPTPSVTTRIELWHRYVPQIAATNPDTLINIAHQRRVQVGEIARAANQPVVTVENIMRQLNIGQRNVLGSLTQRLECPYDWNDLIVNDYVYETLSDFVYEARERNQFWEQSTVSRLFPQGRGLIGLFSGASGTGKTMAAQVIARHLDLDLYRIDLSVVISKYIGETAHNLQQVLSRAESMDVILFFDEADALFSRRTDVKDAHDRHANTDTNYLLQGLEMYSGIAILATNRKSNIDPAFIRRLRYVIEFPKPDMQQRYQLWIHWLRELTDERTVLQLDPLLQRLSQQQETTGAQVKFAALSAVFAARRDDRQVDIGHILRGLDRELAKEGRAMSERDRERLVNDVERVG